MKIIEIIVNLPTLAYASKHVQRRTYSHPDIINCFLGAEADGVHFLIHDPDTEYIRFDTVAIVDEYRSHITITWDAVDIERPWTAAQLALDFRICFQRQLSVSNHRA